MNSHSTAEIYAASESDLAAVCALLVQCGLPLQGAADCLGTAIVARVDGALVGVAGIEKHARYGLLRSVAVAPRYRGHGLARTLCECCASQARDMGLDAIYLLTETACGMFTTLGYRCVARKDVPAAIRACEQFKSICPESATVMVRVLA